MSAFAEWCLITRPMPKWAHRPEPAPARKPRRRSRDTFQTRPYGKPPPQREQPPLPEGWVDRKLKALPPKKFDRGKSRARERWKVEQSNAERDKDRELARKLFWTAHKQADMQSSEYQSTAPLKRHEMSRDGIRPIYRRGHRDLPVHALYEGKQGVGMWHGKPHPEIQQDCLAWMAANETQHAAAKEKGLLFAPKPRDPKLVAVFEAHQRACAKASMWELPGAKPAKAKRPSKQRLRELRTRFWGVCNLMWRIQRLTRDKYETLATLTIQTALREIMAMRLCQIKTVPCREMHPLVDFYPPVAKYFCDECGQRVPARETMRSCHKCKYDICMKCVRKLAGVDAGERGERKTLRMSLFTTMLEDELEEEAAVKTPSHLMRLNTLQEGDEDDEDEEDDDSIASQLSDFDHRRGGPEADRERAGEVAMLQAQLWAQ